MNTLRTLLLCSGLFLMNISVVAQTDSQKNDMINDALLVCIDEFEALYIRINDKEKFLDSTYIRTDTYPTYFKFSEAITGLNLKYVDLSYCPGKEIVKETKTLFFDEAELKDGQFTVKFSIRFIYCMFNHLHASISDGIHVTYEYSAEKEEWICVKSQLWGI